MPIRPENKARYPKDWAEISRRVRARADNKCEWCGVPNYALGIFIEGEWYSAHSKGSEPSDQPNTRGEPFPCYRLGKCVWERPRRIVLTVAHLDHTPENCADENLKALCQRCHNNYDAKMRRAGIVSRARANAALGDLF